MNNAIHDAFINALLAEASYVEGLSAGDSNAVLAGKLRNELTEKLARYAGEKFEVVTQFTDHSGSGLSVTTTQGDRPRFSSIVEFRPLCRQPSTLECGCQLIPGESPPPPAPGEGDVSQLSSSKNDECH